MKNIVACAGSTVDFDLNIKDLTDIHSVDRSQSLRSIFSDQLGHAGKTYFGHFFLNDFVFAVFHDHYTAGGITVLRYQQIVAIDRKLKSSLSNFFKSQKLFYQ